MHPRMVEPPMDDPKFNEKSITKENFVEVASEKISRILIFPGNGCFRPWAVKLLRKASRGFSTLDHEPWIDSLSTVESSGIILSNCDRAMRNLDLTSPSFTSALAFVINHPLKFNSFIAALACLLTKQIEESRQTFCMFQGHLSKQGGEIDPVFRALKTDFQICEIPSGPSDDRNVGSVPPKRFNENDLGPSNKRRKNYECQSLTTDEILRFLKQVWTWAKTGYIQLDAVILGSILSHIPEIIEEVVVSWVKEELGSSRRRNAIGDISNSLSTKNVEIRDLNPCDDDVLHSLSILHESPLLLAAVASSPKLFQQISSILNQVLIQASECSCSLAPLLSLSKTFAQETAKGRAEFYPLQVQPLILLLNEDPNSLSNDDQREIISSQITYILKSQPTEIMIAVLSHFPGWLPFLNLTSLL